MAPNHTENPKAEIRRPNLMTGYKEFSAAPCRSGHDGDGAQGLTRPTLDGERLHHMVRIEKDAEAEAEKEGQWFCAADIARACGTHKKKVHRIAHREKWPSREFKNRLEYQPPRKVAEIVLASPTKCEGQSGSGEVSVRFSDLVAGDDQCAIVLAREAAVIELRKHLSMGKECALAMVANNVKSEVPQFRISVSSLRRWEEAYAAHGIDGLVEQKRGRVGRKAFASDLQTDDILRTAARAVEYGIKGRLNVARAYRDLVASPSVGGAARAWLHGDHASKSSVPPSVRREIENAAPALAVTRMQIGPKAAKLAGPYTICSYEVKTGEAVTGDDMTANVYVWCEWPNSDGFILIRPQVLAMMDIGSMAWLNMRVVMRPKGQYNRDDVWGVIGDTLDQYGLFKTIVLEGGSWQSNLVRGEKTLIDDGERIGGLKALGVKVIHTRSPRGKIIETAFNSLQHAMDNCRGFCGRMEMKDCPEAVKEQLAAVRLRGAHPREFFMHVNEFTEHVKSVMKGLNEERNDGKILRGSSPWEKWSAEKPAINPIPENAKWRYRSAFSVVAVTANGVRVTMGSGRFKESYSYNNVALEVHRGRRVVVYWNDHCPDTDAVVFTIRSGKPHTQICVASRLAELPRFGASEEQSKAEATRKKLAHGLAVAKSVTLAPFLTRGARSPQSAVQSPKSGIGEKLAEVQAAHDAKKQSEARVRASVRGVEVTAEDLDAAGIADSRLPMAESEAGSRSGMSDEEISELFAGDGNNPF